MSDEMRQSIVYGCKGGGLPEFAEVSERITEKQFQGIELDFNTAWCEYAEVPEDDDGLQASETTYDDAVGFLLFSDGDLLEEEVDKQAGGIVYFVGLCQFDMLHIYYGVSGV